VVVEPANLDLVLALVAESSAQTFRPLAELMWSSSWSLLEASCLRSVSIMAFADKGLQGGEQRHKRTKDTIVLRRIRRCEQ